MKILRAGTYAAFAFNAIVLAAIWLIAEFRCTVACDVSRAINAILVEAWGAWLLLVGLFLTVGWRRSSVVAFSISLTLAAVPPVVIIAVRLSFR